MIALAHHCYVQGVYGLWRVHPPVFWKDNFSNWDCMHMPMVHDQTGRVKGVREQDIIARARHASQVPGRGMV